MLPAGATHLIAGTSDGEARIVHIRHARASMESFANSMVHQKFFASSLPRGRGAATAREAIECTREADHRFVKRPHRYTCPMRTREMLQARTQSVRRSSLRLSAAPGRFLTFSQQGRPAFGSSRDAADLKSQRTDAWRFLSHRRWGSGIVSTVGAPCN